jgi:hypothetical protein
LLNLAVCKWNILTTDVEEVTGLSTTLSSFLLIPA